MSARRWTIFGTGLLGTVVAVWACTPGGGGAGGGGGGGGGAPPGPAVPPPSGPVDELPIGPGHTPPDGGTPGPDGGSPGDSGSPPTDGGPLTPDGQAYEAPSRPDTSQAPRAGILDCRNGPEPQWAVSHGAIPSFNACMGTLDFTFGGVSINSGASGGPVSGIEGTFPAGVDRLDCGEGCGLLDEKTLVIDTTKKIVTVVHHGHLQLKFGWTFSGSQDDAGAPDGGDDGGAAPAGSWAPEPYVYLDLVALKKNAVGVEERLDVGSDDVSAFESASAWLLVDRDGAYTLFRRSPGAGGADVPLWRVEEVGDALAAMQKRVAGASGPVFPAQGMVKRYERTNGYLTEIRDFRYPAIIARVFDRDGNNQVVGIREEVDSAGVFADQVTYGYDAGRIDRYTQTGDPTKILYKAAPGLPPLIEKVTTNTGEVQAYEYRADGRLKKSTHKAAATRSPAEDTFYEYSYFGCGGGELADGAAAFPYSGRPFACTVLEKDHDGFGRGTQFVKFQGAPSETVPDRRSYVGRTWDLSLDKVLPGTELTWLRGRSGHLLGQRVTSSGETIRYRPNDSRVAGECVGQRFGGPHDTAPLDVDYEAGDGGASTTPASQVRYSVRCYDDDNMLVRELTPEGEMEITYHKAGHPLSDTAFWNVYGWAAQTPQRIVETYAHIDGLPKTNSRVTLRVVAVGAANSGNADGVYTMHESTTFGGGTSSTVFDRYLRPVGTTAPGSLGWNVTTYDTRGRVNGTKDPTAQVETSLKHRASGNLEESHTSVCSIPKNSVNTQEDPTHRVITETTTKVHRTAGGDLVTRQKHTPEGTNGRFKMTEIFAPGFTKRIERGFSSHGDLVLDETVTTIVNGEETDSARTRQRWRGYDVP